MAGLSSQFKQLQLVMTPREIMAEYSPLDGDRETVFEQRTRTSPLGTSAGDNLWHTPGGRERAMSGRDPDGKIRYSRTRVYDDSVESDEQLWERKYEEATWDEDRYVRPKRAGSETGRSRTTGGNSNYPNYTYNSRGSEELAGYTRHDEGMSLRDSILAEGIRHPISLGMERGSTGKPMIVGGHHRLAVMREHAPDTPIPVLHFKDIIDAKQSKYRKYT